MFSCVSITLKGLALVKYSSARRGCPPLFPALRAAFRCIADRSSAPPPQSTAAGPCGRSGRPVTRRAGAASRSELGPAPTRRRSTGGPSARACPCRRSPATRRVRWTAAGTSGATGASAAAAATGGGGGTAARLRRAAGGGRATGAARRRRAAPTGGARTVRPPSFSVGGHAGAMASRSRSCDEKPFGNQAPTNWNVGETVSSLLS